MIRYFYLNSIYNFISRIYADLYFFFFSGKILGQICKIYMAVGDAVMIETYTISWIKKKIPCRIVFVFAKNGPRAHYN